MGMQGDVGTPDWWPGANTIGLGLTGSTVGAVILGESQRRFGSSSLEGVIVTVCLPISLL